MCALALAEENFGDGFIWAGVTFLHLLGLRERFEVLDVSYVLPLLRTRLEFLHFLTREIAC